VIADITLRMGEGMAKYAGEKTVVTLADYNEYCHYVAGLVGIGLSQMFAASGLECNFLPPPLLPTRRFRSYGFFLAAEKFGQMDDLANSMGLFLQKTNITRDYLEDVTAVNPRIFYPKDIWYHTFLFNFFSFSFSN
jgi:farnesyl-diphosphate farnesyltransferase